MKFVVVKLGILFMPLLLLANASGFARDGSAEIVFPQAIRFIVELTIPASEVAEAELTLTIEGRDPLVLPIDVESAALDPDAAATRLDYIWNIPVDDPPPLFSQIDYAWVVTATDGSTGAFDDSLMFVDPRFDWAQSVDESGRLNVTYPRSMTLDPSALRQVYDLLRRNTGFSRRYNFLLYPSSPACATRDDGTRFARGQNGTEVDCTDGIEAAVLAGYDQIVVSGSASAAVIDQLVDAAYSADWQDKAVPSWFVAGLKQFYNPEAKNTLLLPVQQAARDRTLYALPALASPRDDALWQAQSYAMLMYVVDRVGVQGLFELAQVSADDFVDAYARVVGQSLDALLPALSQWVFTRGAESAFGITAYQAPTATPSSTRTPIPTLTPTQPPTIAPTLAPTSTATQERLTDVPPTVTPSSTPTPMPATVTPRPPGSLPTPTPSPTALELAVAQPGVQAGLITFLLLLLGLLLFLFIRLGNRR